MPRLNKGINIFVVILIISLNVSAADIVVTPENWGADTSKGLTFGIEDESKFGKILKLQTSDEAFTLLSSHNLAFDKFGIFNLNFDYKFADEALENEVMLIFSFEDIIGRPLESKLVFNLEQTGLLDWKHFSDEVVLPRTAATGKVELKISGKTTFSITNLTLTHVEEEISKIGEKTWEGRWIWKQNLNQQDTSPVYFRKEFLLEDSLVEAAHIIITADNNYTLYINGQMLERKSNHDNWELYDKYDIRSYLSVGKNVIAVEAINIGGPAGLLAEVGIRLKDCSYIYFGTDETWRSTDQFFTSWNTNNYNANNWKMSYSYGRPPVMPWGGMPYEYLGPRIAIELHDFSFPSKAYLGETILLKVKLITNEILTPENVLFVSLDREAGSQSQTLFTKKLGDIGSNEICIKESFVLSKYLTPGNYKVKIGIKRGMLIDLKSGQQFDELLIPFVVLDSEFKIENPIVTFEYVEGVPTLFINGKRHTVNQHLLFYSTEELIKNSQVNGIHLYPVHIRWLGWQGEGKYDFTAVDNICASIHEVDPDAYIILVFPLDPINNPEMLSWIDLYPEELVQYPNGETNLYIYGNSRGRVPSIASKLWLATAEDTLRSLIRHVRNKKYGERVIGYAPISGVSWEWQYWGSVGKLGPTCLVDYSRPYRDAFVEWVKQKYDDDLAIVNKAYNKQWTSFSEIVIPSMWERLKRDLYTFMDPKKSQYIIDLNQFHSEVIADAIIRLAKVTKEETYGNSLFGAYYGYGLYVLEPYRFGVTGHFALKKILDAPEIDFLMSPSIYSDRGLGGGSGFMGPVDSVKAHGKLWIDQADIRTHHSDQLDFGRVYTLADSKAVLTRQFANDLISGCASQWYDFGYGWISGDPRLMQLIGKFQEVEEKMLEINRRPSEANSIAVIFDEKSTYYTEIASSIHNDIVSKQYHALAKTGVGFNVYLLDDLEKMPEYKCYIFLNTFRINESTKEYIDKHLKNDGKVLVFIYAPGIIDEGQLIPERVSEIVGINLGMVLDSLPLRVRITNENEYLCKYLSQSSSYGTGIAYGPIFFGNEGEVLGLLEDTNRPGLVLKKYPEWTSIYSSAPLLPAQLIRGIAEFAGIKVSNVNDDDVTYVSGDFLAIHTVDGGIRSLAFPKEQGVVRELITDHEYQIKDGYLSIDLLPRSTYLFYCE